MKILALLQLLLIGVVLSGCAYQRPKTPLISADWPIHHAQVASFNDWQATGKLAIRVPNDGGSMNVRWRQKSEHFQIDFTGPFGQNLLVIAGAQDRVILSEPDQEPMTAKTAEELIRRTTGWTIPVTQLAFWLRGLPAPTAITHYVPNAQGLLGELEQLGWKVTYGDYVSVANGAETIAMPGQMTAEFKDIRLTLVIRAWQLGPTQ